MYPERNSATDLASVASGSVSHLASAEKLAVADTLNKAGIETGRQAKSIKTISHKKNEKPTLVGVDLSTVSPAKAECVSTD